MCKRSAPEACDEPKELLTTRTIEQPVATTYYSTTLERFVPMQFRHLFNLPSRVADCFARSRKILVKATIRDDGARKRRIVDEDDSATSLCSETFEECSDYAHPFAAYFAPPTATPSKSRTLATAADEIDNYPDNVWNEIPQCHKAEATPAPQSTHDSSSMSSPYEFDRDFWVREEAAEGDPKYTQNSLRSSGLVSDDHLPFKKYTEATYGPKAEMVYNDPCVADLQLETLKEMKLVADAVHDGQESVLEKVMAYDEHASLLDELDDVSGPLEERESILERSMLSFQLAKELFEALPTDLGPSALSPQLQPSVTASPPPLVAPLAQEEFENLAEIAHEHGMDPAAQLAKLSTTTLTSHDFGTLLPQMFNGDAKGWLNDNIINEYLEVLIDHAKKKEGYVYVKGKGGSPPPVHAFKSQWFTSMKKDAAATARWARPMHLLGEKLLACNLVLIPVCHNSHWRLIAIKPKDRLIEYYDSLHGSGGPYTQLAKQWVQGVLKEHFVEEEWTISEEQKSEEQANASDCGIFALLNALVLLRGEEHDRVKVTNGMDDARLRVAATLLAGTPTTEMD